jgi:hypothetical protein
VGKKGVWWSGWKTLGFELTYYLTQILLNIVIERSCSWIAIICRVDFFRSSLSAVLDTTLSNFVIQSATWGFIRNNLKLP